MTTRPRFVVCEDGREYLDRFTRFLGDDFTFVPALDFEAARAAAGEADDRRRRLAETQGILILRPLRAAGVTRPAVRFADVDDGERARFLERTLAPLAIGSSHLGIREIEGLLRAALRRGR